MSVPVQRHVRRRSKFIKDRFGHMVKVTIFTTVSLQAKSYEEAIAEARQIKERDVVSFNTDFNDGSIDISAIFDDTVDHE